MDYVNIQFKTILVVFLRFGLPIQLDLNIVFKCFFEKKAVIDAKAGYSWINVPDLLILITIDMLNWTVNTVNSSNSVLWQTVYCLSTKYTVIKIRYGFYFHVSCWRFYFFCFTLLTVLLESIKWTPLKIQNTEIHSWLNTIDFLFTKSSTAIVIYILKKPLLKAISQYRIHTIYQTVINISAMKNATIFLVPCCSLSFDVVGCRNIFQEVYNIFFFLHRLLIEFCDVIAIKLSIGLVHNCGTLLRG